MPDNTIYMTVQELINNKFKPKLQTGGTAVGITTAPNGDLAQKTVRENPAAPGTTAVPGAAPVASKNVVSGELGSKENPMYMITSKNDADKSGIQRGMEAGSKFGALGSLVGAVGGGLGLFNKKKEVPTERKGGTLIPKAENGNPYGLNPTKINIGTGNVSSHLKPQLQGLQGPPTQPTGGGGLGMNAMNIAGAGATVAGLAANTLASLKPVGPINTWGIETQTKKGNRMAIGSSMLSGAGTGASIGAKIGSMIPIPGVGTAIGAGVGALAGAFVGLFKGKKKVKDEAKQIKDETQQGYENHFQNFYANQFDSMKGLNKPTSGYGKLGAKLVDPKDIKDNTQLAYKGYAAIAKCGAKLEVMKKVKSAKKDRISMKGRKFKVGGKINRLGEANIIPSGTLHKEKNNLGEKDKGIPIIDGDGKKVFEVEREELILRLKATKNIEDLVGKYKKTHNAKHLVDMGRLLSEEIMTNTHDFSGRYGLEIE